MVPARIREISQRTNGNLCLYLSLPHDPTGTAVRLTAIEALLRHLDARLTGIRDETPGCAIGFAALERFGDTSLEVYSTDETVLERLVRQGGSGLISTSANLLGRLCRAVIRAKAPEASMQYQQIIRTAAAILRSRPAVPAIKALIARHTSRPVWERMRRPLRPLSQPERAALFRAFDLSGVRLLPATSGQTHHNVPQGRTA
jgi:4-hydroxy-tetrahydrodipicolinate synthase